MYSRFINSITSWSDSSVTTSGPWQNISLKTCKNEMFVVSSMVALLYLFTHIQKKTSMCKSKLFSPCHLEFHLALKWKQAQPLKYCQKTVVFNSVQTKTCGFFSMSIKLIKRIKINFLVIKSKCISLQAHRGLACIRCIKLKLLKTSSVPFKLIVEFTVDCEPRSLQNQECEFFKIDIVIKNIWNWNKDIYNKNIYKNQIIFTILYIQFKKWELLTLFHKALSYKWTNLMTLL